MARRELFGPRVAVAAGHAGLVARAHLQRLPAPRGERTDLRPVRRRIWGRPCRLPGHAHHVAVSRDVPLFDGLAFWGALGRSRFAF